MAKIITEGCVAQCNYCNTKFSFEPNEVQVSFHQVPAGPDLGDEAFEAAHCFVKCPKCRNPVSAEKTLGPEGRKLAIAQAKTYREQDERNPDL